MKMPMIRIAKASIPVFCLTLVASRVQPQR